MGVGVKKGLSFCGCWTKTGGSSLFTFSLKINISGTWRMFGILDAPGASEGKLFKTKEKTTRRAGSIELTMESVA